MTALCPHCGADLAPDEPVTAGPLELVPYGVCRWHGHSVHLTKYEGAVLWSLVKAGGQPISRRAICERIGYEGDDTNIVDVFLTKIRRKFEAAGHPAPIENIRSVGVRLAV